MFQEFAIVILCINLATVSTIVMFDIVPEERCASGCACDGALENVIRGIG
jgi:hypothetical protein